MKKRTRSFRFTVFLSSFWFKVLNDKQNVYVTMNDLFDKPWKKTPTCPVYFFYIFMATTMKTELAVEMKPKSKQR